MRQIRVIGDVPDGADSGQRVQLSEADAHHLVTVLRLRSGHPFRLCDGRGREWEAVLQESGGKSRVVFAELGEACRTLPEPLLQLELCVAVARGDRLERLIEKASELGVHRLTPVLTERTTVEPGGAQRLLRWTRVARESCALAGRAHLLQIGSPLPIAEVLRTRRGFVLDGRGAAWAAGALVSPLALLIGPEGGFTLEELEAAWSAGWSGFSLGPRTLRVETATVVAATLALWSSGDLGRFLPTQ